MAIKREFNQYTIYCDVEGCDYTIETEEEEFYKAIDKAKEEGWKNKKKKNGQWVNVCPICNEEGKG